MRSISFRSKLLLLVTFLAMASACQKKSAVTSDTSLHVERWNNLSGMSKHWVKLERDADGYLVYDPCDGDTPRLEIDSARIEFHFIWDDPYTFKIGHVAGTLTKAGLTVFGSGAIGTVTANANLVDPKNHLVLWAFEINDKQTGSSSFKWLMTPKEHEKEFRHIDNPCPTEKIPEKVFLPIEFP